MDEQKIKRMKEIAAETLGNMWLKDNGEGMFGCEIYADYRDEMSQNAAVNIMTSECPMEDLWEKLSDMYFDEECDTREKMKEKIAEAIENSGEFSDEEILEAKECLDDVVYGLVAFEYPAKKFLNQKFRVNITVDTGDGNYDYTLNSVFPCWYGRKGDTINDKASIVWLSKTQGYRKRQMQQELEKGDVGKPCGFLESLRQELTNLPSHMATLTFLVEMSLEELIELNKGIRLQERNGHFYDVAKRPYCGYITLDKRTETGLYDLWNGGGSVFEIQLEKDVRLPIKFIRSALPDGEDGNYSVESVYGMCCSVWRPDMVKEIHLPRKI